ncbi:MAG: CDGSH iron-sulfur domain-containing protein [Candidatus Odinarchaeota archaeon]
MVDHKLLSREKISPFCRCGASTYKPYCDGSHDKISFAVKQELDKEYARNTDSVATCRCGGSSYQPFCEGNHK